MLTILQPQQQTAPYSPLLFGSFPFIILTKTNQQKLGSFSQDCLGTGLLDVRKAEKEEGCAKKIGCAKPWGALGLSPRHWHKS